MEKMKIKERVNWPVTILLLLGLITVAFPLYMTIVIALKKPSEMTNSISGILSLPSHLSLDNFAEAMRVTDFWHSLGNSVFITLVTVVLSILIHSLLGYAIGRNKKSKFYKFIYFYVVSGMFVPFAILMMPVVKQTAQMGLANRAGVIILYVVFYMPMNVLLYSGYLTNIPLALEEAAYVDGASTWKTYWKIVFPIMKPMHATVAVLTALGTWNDVMTPLVIMSGSGSGNTLPLAQLNFQTQFGTNYNLAFASYLLALLPILIFYLICQIPIGLAMVLCLTTPWTGWVFQIAADGTYQRGVLFVFVSSLQYLYSLVVCIYAVKYGIRETNKERRMLCWLFGIFLIFPLAAGMVQMTVGNTPIIAPAIITSLFIIFVYVQRTQIYNDALTGLNNRKRLFFMLEMKIPQADKEHPMILYLLDANRFK